MSNRWLAALFLTLPLAAGCGVIPDVRLGKDVGIPAISGSTTISVPQDYTCGDPITDPNGKYTVTSKGTADACTFSFKQDVTAIAAADYSSIPELEGARVVNGVDLDVTAFAVRDSATGKEPAGLESLDGKAFGVTILTEADLDETPPFTKSITGEPIAALKSQVQAKEDIVIPIDVAVVVSLTPAPPEKLELDFDAQPNLTIGF